MNKYSNNYNVRDSKGRFTKLVPATQVTTSLTKEVILDKLRTSTCTITYKDMYGSVQKRDFTLGASVIGNYVGKGTSKQTDNNTIFAYDVVENRFRCIKINTISNLVQN